MTENPLKFFILKLICCVKENYTTNLVHYTDQFSHGNNDFKNAYDQFPSIDSNNF